MSDTKPVILSVDDEENVLKSLKRTLRKVDAEILTANSGPAGIEILNAREVDVILSDMRMPEMTGPEFLKVAAEKQPHTRRIVLTGYADADAARDAINDGGVSLYLNKPWDDEELRRVVTDALKMVRLERENSYLNELAKQQNEELAKLNEELAGRVEQRTEQLEHTSGVLSNTLEELEETYEQMVSLVANIATMPQQESEHSRKKVNLALAIGQQLELDDEDLLHLKHGVRLHRLGWVGVPSSVVETPRSEMTQAQREQYELHPSYAEAVLLSVPRLKTASAIVGAQHEEFNGAGFPQNSVGEGIPLGARILAIARDYYDAISGRIFAEQLTPAKAVQFIVDGGGAAYDPELVKIFTQVVKTIDELDVSLDEVLVKSMSLLPGMRLARDLTTSEGAVLLAKGNTLTEATIGTLLNLERRSDKTLQIYVVNQNLTEHSK